MLKTCIMSFQLIDAGVKSGLLKKISRFQIQKPRSREVKYLAQDHTAGRVGFKVRGSCQQGKEGDFGWAVPHPTLVSSGLSGSYRLSWMWGPPFF